MKNKKNDHFFGFTLIELLTCLTVVSVLAALLGGSLKKVMEKGKSVKCMNNLRQLGLAMAQYAQDNDDVFPPALSDTGTRK